MKKYLVVASTEGAVLSQLLKNSYFASSIQAIVADRACGALDVGRQSRIDVVLHEEDDKGRFSDWVCDYAEEAGCDYIISFYLKLFEGRLLDVYRDRILNLHLSLLPAFSGFASFERSLDYGSRYVGTTIHFIDQTVDEGKVIIQSLTPANPETDQERLRHELFEQQCKSLLQVVHWLNEGRISSDGRTVRVENASFAFSQFCPNLDFREAIEFSPTASHSPDHPE